VVLYLYEEPPIPAEKNNKNYLGFDFGFTRKWNWKSGASPVSSKKKKNLFQFWFRL